MNFFFRDSVTIAITLVALNIFSATESCLSPLLTNAGVTGLPARLAVISLPVLKQNLIMLDGKLVP